jgi:thiol-disulfide isomerase/thioredoxin
VSLANLLGNIRQSENGIKYLLGIYLPFLLMAFSFPLGRANQMVIGGAAYFFAGYFFIQWGSILRKSTKSLTFAVLTMLPVVFIYTPSLLAQKYHSALAVTLVSICLFIIGGFFHGHRKRFPIYIVLVCMVLIPFSRFAIPNVLSAKNQSVIPSKQKVDYLEFYTLEGDCWSTEDAKGKYIILDLWTTNCGICFKKFPVFEELYKKHKSEQTIFGAVHLPTYRDTETKVSALISERISPTYTFPVYRSQTDFYSYQSLFNISGVPQVLVINKNSEVEYLGFGNCGDHIVANNLCNYLDKVFN